MNYLNIAFLFSILTLNLLACAECPEDTVCVSSTESSGMYAEPWVINSEFETQHVWYIEFTNNSHRLIVLEESLSVCTIDDDDSVIVEGPYVFEPDWIEYVGTCASVMPEDELHQELLTSNSRGDDSQ